MVVISFYNNHLVIRMNLTVLWNNGDYSKAIKFFKCYLYLLHSLSPSILMTDVRGKNQHKHEDHNTEHHPCFQIQ